MSCSYCSGDKHTDALCFERVKREVSMPEVLRARGVDLRQTSKGFEAICPLPGHGGKRENRPFKVFLAEDGATWLFKCYSCKGKGNVISLVTQLDGGKAKEAVEMLSRSFLVVPQVKPEIRITTKPELVTPAKNITLAEKWSKPGKPHNGRLKGLVFDHPYLAERGFSKELCEANGVGYCLKGKMAGRIVFPICNGAGQVVAYCGRAVEGEPRWLQPEGFHKSLELYGLEKAIESDFDRVFVFESFWGVLAAWRAGIPNAVALMGSDISDAQVDLLKAFRHVVVVMDGDEPGQQASKEIGCRLLRDGSWESVKVIRLPDEEGWRQPDQIEPDDLLNILQ